MVPFDTKSPFVTSGIRLGTSAVTTRGMQEQEMRTIARLIDKVISHPDEAEVKASVKQEVRELCRQFPLYQEINV